MVGHNLNETLIQLIARKATGKGTLINLSVTENGDYDPADEDPPVDGYDYVSVSVETYEDELAQALADLAAAQAQIADYQACQQAVISKIQEYDPNFDPQTCEDIVDKIEEDEEKKEEAEEVLEEVAEEVGADPEDPTYPANVPPAVEAGQGYTFPSSTPWSEVCDMVSAAGQDNAVAYLVEDGVYFTVDIGFKEKHAGWFTPYISVYAHTTASSDVVGLCNYELSESPYKDYNSCFKRVKSITIENNTATVEYARTWGSPTEVTIPVNTNVTNTFLNGITVTAASTDTYKIKNL